MIADVRYALRALSKRPSFTLAAVGILALGIAVNTIAFSLLNSLVLRPIPVPGAGRVVRIYPIDSTGRRGNLFSRADYLDYRRQTGAVVETLAGYIPAEVTAGRSSLDAGPAAPRVALAYVVSSQYFAITGVRAGLGRVLQPVDDDSASRTVVLGHAYWQRRFGGDDRVVGATIVLNGEPFTIGGVATAGFAGTEPLVADVWMPLGGLGIAVPGSDDADRSRPELLLLARLRPGISRQAAAAAFEVVARRLGAVDSQTGRPTGVQIAAGTFFTLEAGAMPIVAVALAVAALVFLIACGNVANLVLARAMSRQREIAVRFALGAARYRIVRQLTVESLVLSLSAGGVALLLSTWALRALYTIGVSLAPFSWTLALTLQPDVRVFGYTLAMAAAGGLLLGLVPSLQASSLQLVGALHVSRTGPVGHVSGGRVRQGLVVVQVAGSLVLLMTAGLLLRGLQQAKALDLGFSTRGVVYAEYDLRAQGYSPAQAAAFNAALMERTRSVAGLTHAAFTSHVPLHGGVHRGALRVLDRGDLAPVATTVTTVSPEYFDVLGITFVAGRKFTDVDVAQVVISDGLARRFWPGEDALGKVLTSSEWPAPRTVVGVVRDAANAALWRDKELSVYLPLAGQDWRDVTVIASSSVDAGLLRGALESSAATLDPNLRFAATPLDELLRLWLLPSRAAAISAGALAILALVLATAGIYAVLSFAVTQRLPEIGIRMALGANARDVLGLVLHDAARLVGAGLLVGAAGAFAVAPLLGRLLFGVRAFDPVTVLAACSIFAAVAFVASYLPARRATQLPPLSVLRVD